jgi:tetratricopeptide (TPR) repeat protein
LVESRRFRALVRLGQAQLKANRVHEALLTAESALAGGRAVAAKYQAQSHEQLVLVDALMLNAQSNAKSRNFEPAEILFREAEEEAQLMAKDREIENVIPLANAESALGNFYLRRKRSKEARACFQHLVDLWNQFPAPNAYVDRQKTIAKQTLASI